MAELTPRVLVVDDERFFREAIAGALADAGIACEAVEGSPDAQERARDVREAFGEEFQKKAAAFLDDPGLSVVSASAAAVEAGGVTSMHDVTEGGLANGLWEVAEASNAGMVVIESEIPASGNRPASPRGSGWTSSAPSVRAL